MPYKDPEKQKQAIKRAVNRHRQGITKDQGKGITRDGDVIPEATTGVIPKWQHRTNGEPYNPEELLPDGRKRYLGPFSDGQVLDRLTVPQVAQAIKYDSSPRIAFIQKELNDPGIIYGIEEAAKLFRDRETRYEKAYRYKLCEDGASVTEIDKGTAARLLQIRQALNSHHVLSEVRYGVSGPTMDTVAEILAA